MQCGAWLLPVLLTGSLVTAIGTPAPAANLKAWLGPEVTDPTKLDAAGKPALTDLRVDVPRHGEAFKVLYLSSETPLSPRFELSTGAVQLEQAFWIRENLLVPVAEVTAAAAERNGIFWLWFRPAADAVPGETVQTLTIHNADGTTLTLPVHVALHPWREPEHPRLSLTSYSLSIGAFGGYPDNMATPERAAETKALLESLAQVGGDTLDLSPTPSVIWPCVRVMATGQPIYEAITEQPELFRARTLPALDFAALTPIVQAGLDAGLGRCILHMSWADDLAGGIPQRLLGDTASPGQADYDRILVWQLSQLRRYLEQRGFAEVVIKLSDEIGAETVDLWIQNARLARAAGLRTMCTWTGYVPRQPETRRKLAPWVDYWQMQMLSAHEISRAVDVAAGLLPADAVVSLYGGGSGVLTLPTTSYRYLGWLAAHHRLDGFGVWAYYWWQPLEKMVAFQDGKLRWSAAYIGTRQAMQEGETLALALDGLERLEAQAAAKKASRQELVDLTWARRARAKLIGLEAGAAVQLQPARHTQYLPAIDFDYLAVADMEPTTFDGARAALFAFAQRLAPYAVPEVWYGRARLAGATSEVIITVAGDASAAEKAAAQRVGQAIRAHTGTAPVRAVMEELTTAQKLANSVIQVGHLPSSYRYDDYALAPNRYPGDEAHPASGQTGMTDPFVVYHGPSPYAAQRVAVLLVGRDEAGTDQAVTTFLHCLTYRGIARQR